MTQLGNRQWRSLAVAACALVAASCGGGGSSSDDESAAAHPNGLHLLYPGPKFEVGGSPRDVAAADFNRDGRLDVVTADGFDGVSILLGTGGGAFRSRREFPAGPAPAAVAVADIDADGALDITVAAQGERIFRPLTDPPGQIDEIGGVLLLLGDGRGNFSMKEIIRAGTRPAGIAVALLDEDEHFDIVVAARDGLWVLWGQGNGAFLPPQRLAEDGSFYSVTTANLDGDEYTDLVAKAGQGVVLVLRGQGGRQFDTGTHLSDGASAGDIVAADVNDDRLDDLLTASYSSDDVSLWINAGAEDFRPRISLFVGPEPESLAVGNVVGDGALDLITVHGAPGEIRLRRGLGNGQFGPLVPISVEEYPWKVMSADMNGDGNADLVTANGSNDIAVFLGDGEGFVDRFQVAVQDNPTGMSVSDFNRDGRPDIITFGSSFRGQDQHAVLLNRGDGTFDSTFVHEKNLVRATAGDFNQDGIPDFIRAIGDTNQIVSGLGVGDGTFQDTFQTDIGVQPWRLQSVDVNDDGRLDLAILAGNLRIMLGGGDGTFGQAIATPLADEARDMAFADVSGDGKLDVVTAHTGFTVGPDDVAVLIGAGDGSFVPAERFTAGIDPSSVTLADLDLDGVADLIASNDFSQRIALLWGLGEGIFAEPEFLSTGHSPQKVEASDLNADGLPDLIVPDFTTSDVSVRIGLGKRRFSPEQRFSPGWKPRGAHVADFNGDGAADIATIDELGDSVTILFAQPEPRPAQFK